MAIKLFNTGERTIVNGDFHLKPKMVGSFTPEVAEKLKRMYNSELLVLEEEQAKAATVSEKEVVAEVEPVIETLEVEEEQAKAGKKAKSGK